MRGERFEIAAVEKQLVNALKSDVDLLCRRFAEGQSTQLEFFADIFKAKEFSTIFLGRLAISELVEFTEYLLLQCARYMVAEATPQQQPLNISYPNYVLDSFTGSSNKGYEVALLKLRANRTTKDRIFGIYMCYCLYFLQPAQYVMPIRVSTRQMNELYRFTHDVLLVEEHFEAMFCLFRLVDCGAFAITPFETEFNPLTLRRFDAYEEDEANVELSELETCSDFPLLTQLSEDVTFKQLSTIHETYKRMKDQCNLPSVSNSSTGVASDLAEFVQKLLADSKAALAAERDADNNASAAGNIGNGVESARNNRAKIRQNAYASTASNSHFESKRRQRLSATPTRAVASSHPGPISPVDSSTFDAQRPSTSKAAAAVAPSTADIPYSSSSVGRKRGPKSSTVCRATMAETSSVADLPSKRPDSDIAPKRTSTNPTKRRIKAEVPDKPTPIPARASARLKAKVEHNQYDASVGGGEIKTPEPRSEATENL